MTDQENKNERLGRAFLSLLGQLVIYLTLGATVMAGMRAVEWLIPKPEIRLMVCMYDELDKLECKTAAELMQKAGK